MPYQLAHQLTCAGEYGAIWQSVSQAQVSQVSYQHLRNFGSANLHRLYGYFDAGWFCHHH